ncbi:hypothetical protein B0H14DRAFT_3437978 [Mycena olivaceomarginata]|nr:hypothetical protein B0H14DRAFT_3437978 [Mycena olivaceomarginata]
MHAPAFKWGDGATRRARWAKRLAKGFFPAHLAIQSINDVDLTYLVLVLFSAF